MQEPSFKYVLPEERPVLPWKDDDSYETVLDGLVAFSHSGLYPMHMPGHKRNAKKFGDKLNLSIDVTESKGMDNLHDPHGPLKRNQARLAERFGAHRSYYMINGSSGGILAGFRTGTKRGDTVIVGRNAHKSSYHAIEICDLNPVFISPEVDESFGMYGSVDPRKVERLLDENPGTALVAITSPTFEGVVSDVREIARICHEHGALLLVDEAHGAHMNYCDRLPDDAVKCGADFVIESLHKTLPSLTSTAVIHISDRVDEHKMAHSLAVFETTSPSHLLLASIDECEAYLEAYGKEEHDKLFSWLDDFSEKMKGLKILRVLNMGDDVNEEHPNCFAIDVTKIVVSTKNADINGMQLMNMLREDYKFEIEMAYGDYAMAMATIGDTAEGLDRFADALLDIDRRVNRVAEPEKALFPNIPARAMRVLDAMEAECEWVSPEESLGRVAAEYAWAYPPGIPLLTPGETVEESVLARFRQLDAQGIVVKTDSHRMPQALCVVKR